MPQQGSHHWIMTLDLPGRAAVTYASTLTPARGATRADVYTSLRDDIARQYPEMRAANTIFFALERNDLT